MAPDTKFVTAGKRLPPAPPMPSVRPRPPGASEKSAPGALAAWLSRTSVVCVILALATGLTYAPVLWHEFINYDDDVYVLNNPHVAGGLTWQNLNWALTTDTDANWFPLTWISHALDCQIYGVDHAGGHHGTNLLLHILNVVLLFLFFSWVTGAKGRSAVLAALFGLHPLNVESVAWVAERKNVLCTLFFSLGLIAYAWYAKKTGPWRYSAIVLLFALGLASKPMVITFPLVLLLLDFWPLGRIRNWTSPSAGFPLEQKDFLRILLEKVPLLTLSAASAILTVMVQKRGTAVASLEVSPLGWRMQNALLSYATYLWKTFLPIRLAPFYPASSLSITTVALSAVFLFAIGWLVWKLSPRQPYLAVGYLWFLGTLVPVIGIIQVGAQSMADRYAYIPLIGVFIAVVWAVPAVVGSAQKRWLAAGTSLVLVVLSLLTLRQLSYWKDAVALWSHTLDVTTNNYVAEEDLAVSLANQGRDDEALPHFIIAQKIRPSDDTATLNIGINLENHGVHDLAAKEFEHVIRVSSNPDKIAEAHRRLGIIFAQNGELQKARSEFVQAAQINPSDPLVLQNLATLEAAEAVDKFSRSLPANPSAHQYLQLGHLLEQDRDLPEARIAYEKALRIDPSLAEARQALRDLPDATPQ